MVLDQGPVEAEVQRVRGWVPIRSRRASFTEVMRGALRLLSSDDKFETSERRQATTGEYFFQLNTISVEFGLFCDATSAAMLIGTCGRGASDRLLTGGA
jgi:hypothetical protein